MYKDLNNLKIAIVGLGYVGLPLAVEFGKQCSVIGFDTNRNRIEELRLGQDCTLEVSDNELAKAKQLSFTSDSEDIRECNFYIVTVPTPIDAFRQPNLTPLMKASVTIGNLLRKGDIVVYESTVYPGATEEICVPILEKNSQLKLNQDFYVGYSPERINPGDKEHRVTNILKVTSGSTPKIADKIDDVYNLIITAGTYKASSIKVAEAAKVIENTQRDVNIALVNELAIIFNRLNIDTEEVLKAAGTKWNFLSFRPGLVGGHCIGVDPYYLTHKAQAIGYNPEIILAGRRLNDGMGEYIASQLVKAMIKKGTNVKTARILVLGLTFKENCPDIRNSKVIDIIDELEKYGFCIDAYDPWANTHEVKQEYNISPIDAVQQQSYDAIILAVAHKKFIDMGIDEIKKFGKENHVIYDIKHIFPKESTNIRL